MTAARALKERWYPELRYGGFSMVDSTVAFYSRVNSVLEPSHVVVDVGCGRGAAAEDPVPWRRSLQTLRGRCARVVGVDVDAAGASNPQIDEFHLIENGRIPLADACANVCVSDAVVEHVDDVDLYFSECARILTRGGYLFVRTPNARSYAAVAARVVPNRLHAKVLSRVQPDRRSDDVFPTLYRCNTPKKLRRSLERHGFDAVVLAVESEPAYLSFSAIAYALGVLHQRYAPSAIRRTLLAYARKR